MPEAHNSGDGNSLVRWALPTSERKSERELDLPLGELPGSVNDTKVASIVHIRIWICELWPIQHVEHLSPELQLHSFRKSEVLEYRGIPGAVTRAVKGVASESTGTRELPGAVFRRIDESPQRC